MTEAAGSNMIPDQSVQLTDLNYSDLRSEQETWMTESKLSEMGPGHKDQMTEVSISDTGNGQKDELTEDGSSDMSTDVEGQLIYRCKKCRQIVASQENVVSHKQGKGEESFRGRKKSIEPNLSECTAIFVEPLKWMQAVEEGYVLEKLYCMRCKTKLGSFNWAGMQCSCGAWVNPAFQILKSRVDVCQI